MFRKQRNYTPAFHYLWLRFQDKKNGVLGELSVAAHSSFEVSPGKTITVIVLSEGSFPAEALAIEIFMYWFQRIAVTKLDSCR